ncbi:MAG: hypothetical protein AB1941_00135 [Gemmatimonadota bacterium]
MRDRALYFPYINVPNQRWLTRMLLYWDSVASIVPSEYRRRPEELAPHMQDLLAAGLVEQVFPAAYIFDVDDFDNPFINYLLERMRYRRQRGGFAPAGMRRFSRIHIEKMGGIADELVRLGVARPSTYPWYEVESWVAAAFMAYLATVLGRLPTINSTPVTNDLLSFRLLGARYPTRENSQVRAHSRAIILNHIFPNPKQPVAVVELADFKARHGDLLRRLRRTVEEKCIQLASTPDVRTRDELTRIVAEELAEQVRHVEEAMRVRWTDVVFSGLASILGAAGALSATPPDQLPARVFGGLSLAAATSQAFGIGRQRDDAFRSPLAYAAVANVRFGNRDE